MTSTETKQAIRTETVNESLSTYNAHVVTHMLETSVLENKIIRYVCRSVGGKVGQLPRKCYDGIRTRNALTASGDVIK